MVKRKCWLEIREGLQTPVEMCWGKTSNHTVPFAGVGAKRMVVSQYFFCHFVFEICYRRRKNASKRYSNRECWKLFDFRLTPSCLSIAPRRKPDGLNGVTRKWISATWSPGRWLWTRWTISCGITSVGSLLVECQQRNFLGRTRKCFEAKPFCLFSKVNALINWDATRLAVHMVRKHRRLFL